MNAIELIQHLIGMSKFATETLLADMAEEPLTAPTPNGGNHPLWIAGHLVYSESRLMTEVVTGDANPLADCREIYRGGLQPVYDAAHYPHTIPQLLEEWNKVREHTLSVLARYSEADLDKPVANCPEGREQMFGTIGKVFSVVGLHPMMHRGQVADARRALGRTPLMV